MRVSHYLNRPNERGMAEILEHKAPGPSGARSALCLADAETRRLGDQVNRRARYQRVVLAGHDQVEGMVLLVPIIVVCGNEHPSVPLEPPGYGDLSGIRFTRPGLPMVATYAQSLTSRSKMTSYAPLSNRSALSTPCSRATEPSCRMTAHRISALLSLCEDPDQVILSRIMRPVAGPLRSLSRALLPPFPPLVPVWAATWVMPVTPSKSATASSATILSTFHVGLLKASESRRSARPASI